MYLLNTSGRPDRFFKDTRVKQEVLMKPVRSLPQVIEMLQKFFLRQPASVKNGYRFIQNFCFLDMVQNRPNHLYNSFCVGRPLWSPKKCKDKFIGNERNISITWGKDLTGFIKTSCFTRVSLKNLSGLPEILRRYK